MSVEQVKPLDTNFANLITILQQNKIVKDDKHNIYAYAYAKLASLLDKNLEEIFFYESLPNIDKRDFNLTDLINSLTHLGFIAKKVSFRPKNIDSRLMPCLFIDKQTKQPLILINRAKHNKIQAFNAATNEEVNINIKYLKQEGDLYIFQKINIDQLYGGIKAKMKAGFGWFKVISERFNSTVKQILFTSIIINILTSIMPFAVMAIYDKVIGVGSIDSLFYIVVGVLFIIGVEAILRAMRAKTVAWLAARLDNIINNSIFEHLLLMNSRYTEGSSIAMQMAKIKSFESVREFLIGPYFVTLIELPFVLILIFGVWLIAGKLVFIPIIMMLFYALIIYLFRGKVKVSSVIVDQNKSLKQRYSMETFIKMHALRYNGIAGQWFDAFKELVANTAKSEFEASFISGIIETIGMAIATLTGLVILWVGVHSIWNGEITMGALIATMLVIWKIITPLQMLCSMLPRLQMLKNSIKQVNNLMNQDIERHPYQAKSSLTNIKGNIKFINVGIRHNKDVEPVFVGMNLDAKAGDIIGITGGSGAGKTTILKLILNLYEPQAGLIKIDDINIKQYDPIELRKYIAYLPQYPDFYFGTIYQNLKIANPLCTINEINEALAKADALDEVNALSKGLETIIGSNNYNLSTALAYKLNLARIFLKPDSKILLLDELPYSVINSETGQIYKNIIKENFKNKTIIFSSERDDFLQYADKVIAMKATERPQVLTASEAINKYRSL